MTQKEQPQASRKQAPQALLRIIRVSFNASFDPSLEPREFCNLAATAPTAYSLSIGATSPLCTGTRLASGREKRSASIVVLDPPVSRASFYGLIAILQVAILSETHPPDETTENQGVQVAQSSDIEPNISRIGTGTNDPAQRTKYTKLGLSLFGIYDKPANPLFSVLQASPPFKAAPSADEPTPVHLPLHPLHQRFTSSAPPLEVLSNN